MGLKVDIRRSGGPFVVEAAIEARPGETLGLLGPNGAGKTTLVRALAGLDPLGAGEVTLGGVLLERAPAGLRVPAFRRSVGVVFHDLLLFPFLTARENVAYGPRARGASRGDALAVADRWLDRLGLTRVAAAPAGRLSGGEAQRVALARALATEPEMLLLDEPLGSLDVEAKRGAARVIREALAEYGGVKILVTHDPVDAITLTDRLVILEEGRVVQEGSPVEVRRRPRTAYVAAFVGLNFFGGVVAHEAGHSVIRGAGGEVHAAGTELPEGTEAVATIHPRSISLSLGRPIGSPRNVLKGPIESITIEGDSVRIWLGTTPMLAVRITQDALVDLGLSTGREIWASFKAAEVDVYER